MQKRSSTGGRRRRSLLANSGASRVTITLLHLARCSSAARRSFCGTATQAPVIVNVTKGELVYAPAEGLLTTQLPGGDRVRRPGSQPRPQRFNPTDEETALVATFFEATERRAVRAQSTSANRRLAAVRQAVGLPQ